MARTSIRLVVLACLVSTVALASRVAVAATDLWWDASYRYRFNVNVTVGPNAPDKGYDGYTARVVTLDTSVLIAAGQMQADCSDLRMAYFDGLGWQELPRHVIGCNTGQTDIRFMLVADIAVEQVIVIVAAARRPSPRRTSISGMTTRRSTDPGNTFAGVSTTGRAAAGTTR